MTPFAVFAVVLVAGSTLADEAKIVKFVPFSGVEDLTGDSGAGYIVAMQPSALTSFDAVTLQAIETQHSAGETFTAVAMRPGWAQVAVANSTGGIEVRRVPSFSLVSSIPLISDGARVVELAWSPQGTYLCALTSAGGILVFDDALRSRGTYHRDFQGGAFWVEAAQGVALAWAQDASQIALAYPNESIAKIVNRFGSPTEWVMWPNGDVVTHEWTQGADYLFSYGDFGRSYEGRTSLLDFDQDQLAVNFLSGHFVSWSWRSKQLTFWNRELFPYAELVSPQSPPTIVKWIGASTIVLWTTWSQGMLYLVSTTSAPTNTTLSLLAPDTNQTLSGVVRVAGAMSPAGTGGSLLIRLDREGWYTLPVREFWQVDVDTRAVKDGSHTLAVGFTDGTFFAPWISVRVTVENGAATPPVAPLVWFAAPNHHASVSGAIEVLVGHYDPNSAVGGESQMGVEISVDGNLWETLPYNNGWRTSMDTSRISDGVHRVLARARVAGIIAATAWVDVQVANQAALGWKIQMQGPPVGSEVDALTEWSGAWSGSPRGTPWIETSINGGPWVAPRTPQMGESTWRFTLPPGNPWPLLKVCVRLADAFAVSSEDCGVFRSSPDIQNRGPTLEVVEAKASVEQNRVSLIVAGGAAQDDHGVLAVFVRVDEGGWILATLGDGAWSANLPVVNREQAVHRIAVMAFDGYLFSAINETEVRAELANEGAAGDASAGNGNAFVALAVGSLLAVAAAVIGFVWLHKRGAPKSSVNLQRNRQIRKRN